MGFVIFGAGAIGGVVGARLHQAGMEVRLVARGAHHDAIKAGGLTLETPEERVTLPIAVARTAADIALGPDDIVLLAVKSQDTAGAIEDLRAAAPATTPVVCLQNGVENERRALRSFAHVYGALVMAATAHLEPGCVQAYGTELSGLIDVGRYPAGIDARCEAIAAALRAARFDSKPQPDVMSLKHAKLIANLANAVEVICGWDAQASELVERACDEGRAVLRAAGIRFAAGADRPREQRPVGEIGGRARRGGSTWQSVARGAAGVETSFLNGEVILHGRLSGVPTPVNELLCALVRRTVHERREPGWMTPDEVLAQL